MIPVTKAYVFESDNEAHINANELSDISDIFEDTAELSLDEYNKRGKAGQKDTSLALEDISYDRDLKNVNVPNNSRQKPTLFDPGNKVLKQVSAITSGNAKEIKTLDEHYKKLDEKKREADKNAAAARGQSVKNESTSANKGKGAGKAGDLKQSRSNQDLPTDGKVKDEVKSEDEDQNKSGKDGAYFKSGKGGRFRSRDGNSNPTTGTGAAQPTGNKDGFDRREMGYQRRGNRDPNMKSKSRHSDYGYFGAEYDLAANALGDNSQYPFGAPMDEQEVYGAVPPVYGNFIPPINYYGNYYAPTQPFEAPILPPLPTLPTTAAPAPIPLPVSPMPLNIPSPTSSQTDASNGNPIEPSSSSDKVAADNAASQNAPVLNPFAQEFVPSFMLR